MHASDSASDSIVKSSKKLQVKIIIDPQASEFVYFQIYKCISIINSNEMYSTLRGSLLRKGKTESSHQCPKRGGTVASQMVISHGQIYF